LYHLNLSYIKLLTSYYFSRLFSSRFFSSLFIYRVFLPLFNPFYSELLYSQ